MLTNNYVGHVTESGKELDYFSIYFSFCIVISNYLYMYKQHIRNVNTGNFLNGVGKFICNTVGCRLINYECIMLCLQLILVTMFGET